MRLIILIVVMVIVASCAHKNIQCFKRGDDGEVRCVEIIDEQY